MDGIIVIACYFSIIMLPGVHCANRHRPVMCDKTDSDKRDESMLMVAALLPDKMMTTYPHARTSGVRTFFSRLSNSECPTRLPKSSVLCPHYVVLNFDRNRIPNVIYEARCKCSKCLEMQTKECRPVYFLRSVLQRKTSRSCFERKVIAISLGCQCHTMERMNIHGDPVHR
ncbi:uncharacterized protein [Haliotis cracherodii]|uniref:uncharacterized protein n=1 Tax=Haliotis cracherodii TaxID=6455 RepID=UPI0039E7B0DE